jgi:hypothetical protein
MKKTIQMLMVLGLLSVGVAGASVASAYMGGRWNQADPAEVAERQMEMFEHQAEVLGVDVDQIKNAWAEGKNLPELAEELGVSEDELMNRMQEQRQERMQERVNALVEQGVITQEQADQRQVFMQERMGQGGFEGKGRHHGMRGERLCN